MSAIGPTMSRSSARLVRIILAHGDNRIETLEHCGVVISGGGPQRSQAFEIHCPSDIDPELRLWRLRRRCGRCCWRRGDQLGGRQGRRRRRGSWRWRRRSRRQCLGGRWLLSLCRERLGGCSRCGHDRRRRGSRSGRHSGAAGAQAGVPAADRASNVFQISLDHPDANQEPLAIGGQRLQGHCQVLPLDIGRCARRSRWGGAVGGKQQPTRARLGRSGHYRQQHRQGGRRPPHGQAP
jgi:hypothetical protein